MDRIIPGVCLLLVAAIIVAGLIWLRSMSRKNDDADQQAKGSGGTGPYRPK